MALSKSARDLSARMRARADQDGLAPDNRLRQLADELDAAISGFYAADQTVPVAQFVGAWARARRAWHVYSGEPLL